MSRPAHLTPETDIFQIDGSSALAVDFGLAVSEQPEHRHLHAVPDLPVESASFLDAEMVPEFSERRARAAQEFADILSRKRDLIFNGEGEKVNEQIDALGTAKLAFEAKQKFGKDSPEYREKRAATKLDSARLIYESASKNGTEYFDELLRIYAEGHYYSNGISISDNVVKGITPKAHPEEVERQGKELAEERTYEAIGDLIKEHGLQGAAEYLAEFLPGINLDELDGETSIDVITASMCANYAQEMYKADPKGTHGGYSASPDVLKMMIRGTHFRDDSGNRYDEVAAVNGVYFDEELINEVIAETTVMAKAARLDKVDILGVQNIGVNTGPVRDMVRRLDEKAGAKYGVNLFWGEVKPDDFKKDYEAFERQAEIRQKKFEPMPDELADFLESLVEAGTPTELANYKVVQFLKSQLLELSEARPEIAALAFDADTAQGFRDVAQLRRAGRFDDAQLRLAEVKENAPDPTWCGGGGGGGRWLIEQMEKLARIQSRQQLTQHELAEEYGTDINGVPLAFYCEDCGTLNVRNDPKRRRADGTFIYKAHCDGCHKETSCGDPDAF